MLQIKLTHAVYFHANKTFYSKRNVFYCLLECIMILEITVNIKIFISKHTKTKPKRQISVQMHFTVPL